MEICQATNVTFPMKFMRIAILNVLHSRQKLGKVKKFDKLTNVLAKMTHFTILKDLHLNSTNNITYFVLYYFQFCHQCIRKNAIDSTIKL